MARKAAIESDIDKRYRRAPQQFLSSFQLQVEQVIVWAVPRRCPKHTDEMDAAIAALVRQSPQAQIPRRTCSPASRGDPRREEPEVGGSAKAGADSSAAGCVIGFRGTVRDAHTSFPSLGRTSPASSTS